MKTIELADGGILQALDALSEFGLARTNLVQKRQLLGEHLLFQGTMKQLFFDHDYARFASMFLNEKWN